MKVVVQGELRENGRFVCDVSFESATPEAAVEQLGKFRKKLPEGLSLE